MNTEGGVQEKKVRRVKNFVPVRRDSGSLEEFQRFYPGFGEEIPRPVVKKMKVFVGITVSADEPASFPDPPVRDEKGEVISATGFVVAYMSVGALGPFFTKEPLRDTGSLPRKVAVPKEFLAADYIFLGPEYIIYLPSQPTQLAPTMVRPGIMMPALPPSSIAVAPGSGTYLPSPLGQPGPSATA